MSLYGLENDAGQDGNHNVSDLRGDKRQIDNCYRTVCRLVGADVVGQPLHE